MNLAGYRVAMHPIDLVENCLFGDHLDVLVDRRVQIMAFFRRRNLRDTCGHVPRIDRHALVAVLPAKLVLVK
ncbi:hypothetical protein D3C81_1151300 [compost metagenome]